MPGVPAPIVQSVVDDIGDILDRLFPAPEEHAKAELARHEIARLPALKQIDLAEPCSLFVAGWRPTIGWVCALALTWAFLLQPVALWVVTTFDLGVTVPAMVTDHLLELVLAMLGIAGLRTFEKTQRR
jgi:Holin of 3TMs, for gene-transfer release